MSKTSTITAVDIGTSVVKAIIVQKNPEETGFKVLGKAENISSGVRKGVVADPDKVAKIVQITVEEHKEKLVRR